MELLRGRGGGTAHTGGRQGSPCEEELRVFPMGVAASAGRGAEGPRGGAQRGLAGRILGWIFLIFVSV